MFTKAAKGVVYIGQDPTGGGFVRLPVEGMTREQAAAWLLLDPATARRYIDPTRVGRYTPPKFDNAPGAPLPKLKTDDEQRATKKGSTEKDDAGA